MLFFLVETKIVLMNPKNKYTTEIQKARSPARKKRKKKLEELVERCREKIT